MHFFGVKPLDMFFTNMDLQNKPKDLSKTCFFQNVTILNWIYRLLYRHSGYYWIMLAGHPNCKFRPNVHPAGAEEFSSHPAAGG